MRSEGVMRRQRLLLLLLLSKAPAVAPSAVCIVSVAAVETHWLVLHGFESFCGVA
jgi:hypothetical protein